MSIDQYMTHERGEICSTLPLLCCVNAMCSIVRPNMKYIQKMLDDDRLAWQLESRCPLWALNYLKYFRPDGRSLYLEYGKIASAIVAQGQSDGAEEALEGDGTVVGLTSAFTLLGDIEWDEIAVMGYSSLSAFFNLQRNKQWAKAEKQYRQKGLVRILSILHRVRQYVCLLVYSALLCQSCYLSPMQPHSTTNGYASAYNFSNSTSKVSS